MVLGLTLWNTTRSEALREAEDLYARGDRTLALCRALDHLGRRPWSRPAAVLAARCLSERDFADLAEAYYARASTWGPLGLEALQARALGLTRANRREGAIVAYRDILRRRPDDPTALRRLAAVYYSRRQLRPARELAGRLARVPGAAVPGLALLGTIAQETRDFPGAIAAYRRILDLDPGLRALPFPAAIFWRELTGDLCRSGRAEEARALLIGALSLRDDAWLHYNRGVVEKALGAPDEAEAAWRRALQRDPDLSGAWLGLGLLALNRHRPDEAIASLRRAVALAPDDREGVYALSLACGQLGRADEAARLARRAEQIRAREKRPPANLDDP